MNRFATLLLTFFLLIAACSKNNGNNNNNNGGGGPPPGPTVTTFAGSGTPAAVDGAKEQASFNFPTGITIDVNGDFFVADKQNNIIRFISPQGVVTTIAGTTASGFSNTKGAVKFNFPAGIGVDANGNVFVGDQGNSAIRKITTLDVTTTFAGNGAPGFKNGPDTAARFSAPAGIVADAAGNVYVADNGNNVIRKITPGGLVSTYAGSGSRGSVNGPNASASFNQPQALAVAADGTIYVADMGNNLIRKISPLGQVSTLAGSGAAGAVNGIGIAASFSAPAGVAVDASGNVYVGDSNNNLIRKVSSNGNVTTLAGTGSAGSANGVAHIATFNSPQGVAVDPYGRVFVADTGNSLIRMIQ